MRLPVVAHDHVGMTLVPSMQSLDELIYNDDDP